MKISELLKITEAKTAKTAKTFEISELSNSEIKNFIKSKVNSLTIDGQPFSKLVETVFDVLQNAAGEKFMDENPEYGEFQAEDNSDFVLWFHPATKSFILAFVFTLVDRYNEDDDYDEGDGPEDIESDEDYVACNVDVEIIDADRIKGVKLNNLKASCVECEY